MSDYKGFRIWTLEFQAMTTSTTGVDTSAVESGRLSIPSTGARYWTFDDKGLKAHLEDYLKPMWDDSNDVGWSLDTDLYERLNNLDQSSRDVRAFKKINPNSFYTPTNLTGEKTVKLVPTSYVRAMFFKHTSGYKAMIGLSLYAMDTNSQITNFYSAGNGNSADPGFPYRHVIAEYGHSSSNHYSAIGGLFIAMIPPANLGDIQDDWRPEFSIHDDRFYAPTMTPIVPMMHTHWYYSSSNDQFYNGACWLKTGTSTLYNSTSAGVIVGTNMKLSLMLDSLGNIGLAYKYTYSSNTTNLNPMIFMGPMYSKSLSSSDTLCTRSIAWFTPAISGASTDSSSFTNYNQSAWNCSYNSTYYNYYYHRASEYLYAGYINSNGSSYGSTSIFTSYPALSSGVYTNYRYAKAGYVSSRLLDERIIRWASTDGLVLGQTYNDGQWICLGNSRVPYAQDGTSSSSYLYPQLRWDGEFNGTKTFA